MIQGVSDTLANGVLPEDLLSCGVSRMEAGWQNLSQTVTELCEGLSHAIHKWHHWKHLHLLFLTYGFEVFHQFVSYCAAT